MLLPSLPLWLLSATPKDPAELERDVPEPIDAHGELAEAITAAITAVDLVGVFFFAISGAVLAVRKGYDIVGSLLLALMVGTGGGVVRDLVVGRDVPAAFDNPWYLILPAVASLAVFLRIFDGEASAATTPSWPSTPSAWPCTAWWARASPCSPA
ncbi:MULTISPECIES: trimeric intracellular cation channel family protein [Micrococcus]|uniref:trimeric intracellular cation channel family protein n=1 Tax=Micrococcus TaxID=1269 RepID=UPI0024AF2BC4|nr:TRIC cation channel family protein [Micrococcus yunnanensis]WHM16239.1 TRIC cation channel family protein [Micrococcus yunnanensis]